MVDGVIQPPVVDVAGEDCVFLPEAMMIGDVPAQFFVRLSVGGSDRLGIRRAPGPRTSPSLGMEM